MYITFKVESVSLERNQNPLSFVSKEKFLKSDIVKRNHGNMKSNDGIPSHHGKENEGTHFFR